MKRRVLRHPSQRAARLHTTGVFFRRSLASLHARLRCPRRATSNSPPSTTVAQQAWLAAHPARQACFATRPARRACPFADRTLWIEHFSASALEHAVVHQLLHRVAAFLYEVVCAFVIQDLNGLLERHVRKASAGFLSGRPSAD